jgi:AcrR family transcriptional regulator
MTKRREKRALTKQDLIDAFWSLYRLKRLERISVREIVEKAGYNRSTFYEYFTDVPAVLECIESSLVPEPDELPPIVRNPDSDAFSVDVFLKQYRDHGDYYQVLLGTRGDPAFQGRLKAAMKPILLRQAEARGATRDTELDYSLELVLSALIGVLGYWIQQDEPVPPERLVGWIHDALENGFMKKLSGVLHAQDPDSARSMDPVGSMV